MLLKILQTISLLAVLVVLFILKEAGFFHKINPHFDGSEIVIESAAGVEDIVTDLENADVYFSSHDRRNFETTGMLFKASVMDENLDLNPILPKELPFPFRPHGISLFKTEDGNKYLFVVNHEDDLNSIIRFRVFDDSLVFEKRFVHEQIKFPNDVQAIGLNSFYITNDHTIPNGLRRFLGDFLLEKSGNVVFFQDGDASVVSQNIAYPNGINISPDKKYLYVAATTENKLYVYSHTQDFGPRKILDQKYLWTAPDNIEIDKFGDLWIGCHPKLLKYLGHAKDISKNSPSEVIKVVYQPGTKHKFLQEEVYMNDGNPISGSSVASYFITDTSNTLLIGSVFEEKVVKLHRNL
ncbi:Arylesterase [Spirosomataceae bacterium TFI 002]|nr:Arylesterase [Spirosomataceae bacterium TFI 002]